MRDRASDALVQEAEADFRAALSSYHTATAATFARHAGGQHISTREHCASGQPAWALELALAYVEEATRGSNGRVAYGRSSAGPSVPDHVLAVLAAGHRRPALNTGVHAPPNKRTASAAGIGPADGAEDRWHARPGQAQEPQPRGDRCEGAALDSGRRDSSSGRSSSGLAGTALRAAALGSAPVDAPAAASPSGRQLSGADARAAEQHALLGGYRDQIGRLREQQGHLQWLLEAGDDAGALTDQVRSQLARNIAEERRLISRLQAAGSGAGPGPTVASGGPGPAPARRSAPAPGVVLDLRGGREEAAPAAPSAAQAAQPLLFEGRWVRLAVQLPAPGQPDAESSEASPEDASPLTARLTTGQGMASRYRVAAQPPWHQAEQDGADGGPLSRAASGLGTGLARPPSAGLLEPQASSHGGQVVKDEAGAQPHTVGVIVQAAEEAEACGGCPSAPYRGPLTKELGDGRSEVSAERAAAAAARARAWAAAQRIYGGPEGVPSLRRSAPAHQAAAPDAGGSHHSAGARPCMPGSGSAGDHQAEVEVKEGGGLKPLLAQQHPGLSALARVLAAGLAAGRGACEGSRSEPQTVTDRPGRGNRAGVSLELQAAAPGGSRLGAGGLGQLCTAPADSGAERVAGLQALVQRLQGQEVGALAGLRGLVAGGRTAALMLRHQGSLEPREKTETALERQPSGVQLPTTASGGSRGTGARRLSEAGLRPVKVEVLGPLGILSRAGGSEPVGAGWPGASSSPKSIPEADPEVAEDPTAAPCPAPDRRRCPSDKGLPQGVSLQGGTRFRASIWRDGRMKHLGHYDTPERAARAFDRGAVARFNEGASKALNLNYPEEWSKPAAGRPVVPLRPQAVEEGGREQAEAEGKEDGAQAGGRLGASATGRRLGGQSQEGSEEEPGPQGLRNGSGTRPEGQVAAGHGHTRSPPARDTSPPQPILAPGAGIGELRGKTSCGSPGDEGAGAGPPSRTTHRPPRQHDLPHGVYWHGGRFKASIWCDGRMRHVGTFSCPNRAARAYDSAAVQRFNDGKSNILNFNFFANWSDSRVRPVVRLLGPGESAEEQAEVDEDGSD
ncbi:hypothetical protein HYH03_002327 [Edaphochlamys debaryana]|uniref:AP2/ERF domain-containing protein n=1 Tax=Edaphochlamys debaryana TaxID=47281 RepID=A0A835YEA2_9CHLO|nr:hypothetical protein HYH03_002327 [Edaphochlamys debaryana]|eukprot:KAG2500047.1 hypothetical protein HYH03_002327 [Edaphochlamys debaryana]